MKSLFGLSMTTIMIVLLVAFAVCLAVVVSIYFRNRVMFKMGIRNLPRRGAQTALVVVGLMLSTLIITAAFATGDTVDYSITNEAYEILQRTDLLIDFSEAGQGGADANRGFADEAVVGTFESEFANDGDIEGFLPYLVETLPVLNTRTNLSEPAVAVTGFDPARQAALGGIHLEDGSDADLAGLAPDEVLLTKKAAENLDARVGDTLTIYALDQPHTFTVKGIAANELAAGGNTTFAANNAGGLGITLASAQALTGHGGKIDLLGIALRGDVRGTIDNADAVADRVEAWVKSDTGRQTLGIGALDLDVEPIKKQAVDIAVLVGSVFVTFFLVLGMFSIAAGILLIFMIFVMLAAERKPEMGMARAVGARREHLAQMFIAEGMAYSLIAGAVGAALGVGAAFLLIVVGMRVIAGDLLGDVFQAYVTPRSIIVSYTLGVVVTFITIVISSNRVSRLNIVAAIRGTEDEYTPRQSFAYVKKPWIAFGVLLLIIPPLGLWFIARKGLGQPVRWKWVVLGTLVLLPLAPLGIYWMAGKGFSLPRAWVWGPAAIVFGLLFILSAGSSNMLWQFALGVSLLPIGVALLARYYGAPSRLTWTLVAVYLAIYWLAPIQFDKLIYGEPLDSNIEMFVISGIMVTVAFTLIIVFNARLLETLFEQRSAAAAYRVTAILAVVTVASFVLGFVFGDAGEGAGQLFHLVGILCGVALLVSFAAARFPQVAPALKTAVAYPLASQFRTGMTIAMFTLIVFSLVVMSVLNANFGEAFASEDARGGWDIVGTTNRNNPIVDLKAALPPETAGQLTNVGRVGFRVAEVRQVGEEEWNTYPIRPASDSFFQGTNTKLEKRAVGYDSDQAVWDAIAANPNLAVVDFIAVSQSGFGTEFDWKASLDDVDDDTFQPLEIEYRDRVTQQTGKLTVIGVLDAQISASIMYGMYTTETSAASVLGPTAFEQFVANVTPGADADTVAKAIRAALVTQGVDADATSVIIEDEQQLGIGFNRLFQAFMGLGLIVGIAALGVISFRSVVERRQQIGMLRAIGYQRGSVTLSFLLESSFIALMGILAGVTGAVILSRNVFFSDSSFSDATNFTFFIPWREIAVFVVIAYVFSLLMTWWPSRQAANTHIAEALRYE